jgi:hypothetical protein
MKLDQYSKILSHLGDYLGDAWTGLSDDDIKSRMHEFITIKDILRKYVDQDELDKGREKAIESFNNYLATLKL